MPDTAPDAAPDAPHGQGASAGAGPHPEPGSRTLAGGSPQRPAVGRGGGSGHSQRSGRAGRDGDDTPAARALREIGENRAQRAQRDRVRAAAGVVSSWGALRRTLGVTALSDYDQVMTVAREQLAHLGYREPQPVSWRWGTLVVEAGALDAARLRLDASRLCQAVAGALDAAGSVTRIEVRVVR
jgi:hypothetical protein